MSKVFVPVGAAVTVVSVAAVAGSAFFPGLVLTGLLGGALFGQLTGEAVVSPQTTAAPATVSPRTPYAETRTAPIRERPAQQLGMYQFGRRYPVNSCRYDWNNRQTCAIDSQPTPGSTEQSANDERAQEPSPSEYVGSSRAAARPQPDDCAIFVGLRNETGIPVRVNETNVPPGVYYAFCSNRNHGGRDTVYTPSEAGCNIEFLRPDPSDTALTIVCG